MKNRFASMAVCAGLALLFLAGTAPMVAADPPEVVLIPGAGVYFVPDAGANLLYHDGFWWTSRGDRWYRSRAYNGPWVAAERCVVPVEVVRAPEDNRVRLVDRHDSKEHRKYSKRGHVHND